jgi:uridine phosphorylase
MYAGVTVPIYRITNPEDEAAAPRQVAVFRSGMGAPFAAAMVEELIARGARNIIVFGSCGVLDERLAAGHYIVPTEAYRDEGTSYHYAAPADYIRIRNADKVAEVLSDRNIPFVKSRIWTTDGLYRETRGNTAARLADGCIAVDMECSALQAVCDLRSCEIYQFVYAEDSLGGDTWEPRNMGKVTPGEMEFHLRAALAIAAAL